MSENNNMYSSFYSNGNEPSMAGSYCYYSLPRSSSVDRFRSLDPNRHPGTSPLINNHRQSTVCKSFHWTTDLEPLWETTTATSAMTSSNKADVNGNESCTEEKQEEDVSVSQPVGLNFRPHQDVPWWEIATIRRRKKFLQQRATMQQHRKQQQQQQSLEADASAEKMMPASSMSSLSFASDSFSTFGGQRPKSCPFFPYEASLNEIDEIRRVFLS